MPVAPAFLYSNVTNFLLKKGGCEENWNAELVGFLPGLLEGLSKEIFLNAC